MNKVWLAGLGGAMAGLVISTQFAGPILAQEQKDDAEVYQQLDLFGDVFERIRNSYVEPVTSKQLVEAAINGMLQSLDPHSSYMPADDFDDMQVQTKGEFGGLGSRSPRRTASSRSSPPWTAPRRTRPASRRATSSPR